MLPPSSIFNPHPSLKLHKSQGNCLVPGKYLHSTFHGPKWASVTNSEVSFEGRWHHSSQTFAWQSFLLLEVPVPRIQPVLHPTQLFLWCLARERDLRSSCFQNLLTTFFPIWGTFSFPELRLVEKRLEYVICKYHLLSSLSTSSLSAKI